MLWGLEFDGIQAAVVELRMFERRRFLPERKVDGVLSPNLGIQQS